MTGHQDELTSKHNSNHIAYKIYYRKSDATKQDITSMKSLNTKNILAVAALLIGLVAASGLLNQTLHQSSPERAKQQIKVSGPQPASFYSTSTKDPISSKLSFEEISKKVFTFQNTVGLTDGGSAKILAYVFFDPLCKHCAKQAINLLKPDAISIVNNIAWVPIGYLEEYSTLQGATLLASPAPAIVMAQHAYKVINGNGEQYKLNVKIAKQEDVDKVVTNTNTWQETGAEKVPFTVTRDPSGKTLALYGVLEGFQMAEFLSKGSE